MADKHAISPLNQQERHQGSPEKIGSVNWTSADARDVRFLEG